MSRAYDFVLRSDSGRYDKDAVLSFPSVTTIISAVYAKPQLVPWSIRQTLDGVGRGIEAAYETFPKGEPGGWGIDFLHDLLDTITDPDMFDEWIRESHIHPDDVTNEASQRGTDAHALLATLARTHRLFPDKALAFAERKLQSTRDPFQRSVAGWWLQAEPQPIFSEKVVVHLGLRYAGRLDLGVESVKIDPSLSFHGIIDLKTRRADLGVYKSDEMQTGLYKLAAQDQGLIGPTAGTAVLLAGDDGEPARLMSTWVPDEAAIKIVELYWLLRRTDSNGRKVR